MSTDLPTRVNLQLLGPREVAVFALGCAQRVSANLAFIPDTPLHILGPESSELAAVRGALDLAERALSSGFKSVDEVRLAARNALDAGDAYYKRMIDSGHRHHPNHDFDAWFDGHHDHGYRFRQMAEVAAMALETMLLSQAGFVGDSAMFAERAAASAKAIFIGHWYSDPVGRQLVAEIFQDYENLRAKSQWNDKASQYSAVSAINAKFDTTLAVGGTTIIAATVQIQARLLERISRRPELMYTLSPRDFEMLVAEFFDDLGFPVELTAAARDGGRDVIAVRHEVVKEKYLVECKRYARENKVGIAPVQRLYGVVQDEGATKGILATTAEGFTADARRFLERHCWVLDGRDYHGLIEWLQHYEREKIARAILRDLKGT